MSDLEHIEKLWKRLNELEVRINDHQIRLDGLKARIAELEEALRLSYLRHS